MRRLIVLSLSMTLVRGVLATNYQWRNAQDGEFQQAANWNPNSAYPTLYSDQARWYTAVQGHAVRVTLPEGDWTDPVQWRFDANKDGTELTFDGSKTVYAPSALPDVAAGNINGEPFACYDEKSHFFSFERYANKQAAPFVFTNPKWRVLKKDGASQLHFDSGTFNFYGADGVSKNFDFTISYGAPDKTVIGFHGADVSIANVNIRSGAAVTELLVDAGTLDAKTKLEIPTLRGGDVRTEVDLVVTNSGTLMAGNLILGYSGKPRDIKVKVADNGLFKLPIPASYTFSQQTGGSTLDWEVSNGGTVYLGHNLAFSWDKGCSSVVHLDHGNWLSYNETTVGGDVVDATCVFAATNSFIDAYLNNASAMFRINKDMIVKDCVWTNNYLYAFPANTSPSLTVEGGRWVNLSRIRFAGKNGSISVNGGEHELYGQVYIGYDEQGGHDWNATLNVSGPDTKIKMSSGEMIAFGWNCRGDFNLEGGEISLPSVGGLSFAHIGSDSLTVATMSGGKIVAPSSETSIVVGRAGHAEFTQSGGEIVAKSLWLGQMASATDPRMGYYHQTGGKADFQYVNMSHASANTEVALDGGTFTVGFIESWGGSTAAGGTGRATLSADGGTLRSKFAVAGFVQKIDAVELGPKGLTVDTDYDVTIKQDITAKDANGGKLIKTGRGTLTIDGRIADTIEVVVLEGKVVFGKTSELAALTIGSETSAGAIALGGDAELSVKGAVMIYHNASPDDFSFTKDDQGVTRIVPDGSPARSLEIRLDEAVSSNATEDVQFRAKDTLTASVAQGGTLNLNGQLARGAFVKTGAGTAVLAHVLNEFIGGVSADGGILSVDDIRALGLSFVDPAVLTLKRDTFAYTSSTPGETPAKLAVRAETVTEPTVVKTDGDITFKGGVDAVSGALVKGGAGKLTLEVANGQTLAAANAGTGTGINGCPQNMTSFNVDGSFSGEHGALTVVEGTLAVKGTGVETVNAANALIAVGVQNADVVVQPKLTVDGVTLNNNMHLFVGGFVQPNMPSGFATTSTVEVVNGGVLKCDTLRVGFQSGSRGCYPFVHLDGGTLDAGFRVNCSDHQNNTHARYLFENGSVYKVGSYNYSSWQTYWEGDAEFIFDNSTYAIAGSQHYGYLYLQKGGRGSMLFRNGAKAYVQNIEKRSGTNWQLTMAFDNGEWIPSAGDYDFIYRGGEGMTIDCRAGGLSLSVPAAATWTVHQKFSGVGGIVKSGTGTLAFETAAYYDTYNNERTAWADTASWKFTGVARVEAGTLAVANGAADAAAQAELGSEATFRPGSELAFGKIAGTGVVSGGGLVGCALSSVTVDGVSLTRPTFALAVDEDGNTSGVPNLKNCAFVGKCIVDLNRTEEDPLPQDVRRYVIATFEGPVPNLGTVKVVNAGYSGAGVVKLSVEGNTIVADICKTGFAIIVR